MKNKNTLYTLVDGEVLVCHSKAKYGGLFDKSISLEVLPTPPKKGDVLNFALLNPADYEKLSRTKVLLHDSSSGLGMQVRIYPDVDTPLGKAILSKRVRTVLHLEDNAEIVLSRYVECTLESISTQTVELIKKNVIVLSSTVANTLKSLANGKVKLFQLYNEATGDNIIIKREHILVDDKKKDGDISLTRKQRITLGIEGTTATLKIIPVSDSIFYTKKKSVWSHIVDFYVGKSTISLRCTRPYENDEGSDIVRLSSANMKLLGVEEMDQVVLRYKNKSKKCRVLSLDDKDEFLKTNKPTSIDLSIGVPAHIRSELGVYDLNSSVKVDRDTSVILGRSLNEQIVPILLTIFSSKTLAGGDVWVSILLSLLAIPIITYLNLSSKRKMRVE